MKRIIQKIKSYSNSIELTESDKADLRAKIVDFMHANPMEDVARKPRKAAVTPSPYWAFFNVVKQPLALSLIIAFLAGGSISFAAEGALPGDNLYPVKVYFSETVYESFTFRDEAKAQWKREKAERRLEEIETLVAQGRLNSETTIIAQAHLDKALDAIETSDHDHAEFEAALAAHADVLAKIDRNNLLASSSVNVSIAKAKQRKQQATVTTALAVPTSDSAKDKMRVAEERVALVAEKINELSLEEDTDKRVQRHIKKAFDRLEKGSKALDSGNFQEAQDAFIESMTIVQEAKLIATMPKQMSFDVVEAGTTSTKIDVEFVPKKEKESEPKTEVKEEVKETLNKATDALFSR